MIGFPLSGISKGDEREFGKGTVRFPRCLFFDENLREVWLIRL